MKKNWIYGNNGYDISCISNVVGAEKQIVLFSHGLEAVKKVRRCLRFRLRWNGSESVPAALTFRRTERVRQEEKCCGSETASGIFLL